MVFVAFAVCVKGMWESLKTVRRFLFLFVAKTNIGNSQNRSGVFVVLAVLDVIAFIGPFALLWPCVNKMACNRTGNG